MKRLRVLVLMHKDLVPPEPLNGQNPEGAEWRTEYDVVSTLKKLGHDVQALGVKSDLEVIRTAVEGWKPHIAFNLLEEFDGLAVYDQNVVSYLELMRIPYTGCNPRGLMLARDKALAKQVMSYHRIPYPEFMVVPLHRMVRRPKYLSFPLIVKSITEEASLGISQASIVDDDEKGSKAPSENRLISRENRVTFANSGDTLNGRSAGARLKRESSLSGR